MPLALSQSIDETPAFLVGQPNRQKKEVGAIGIASHKVVMGTFSEESNGHGVFTALEFSAALAPFYSKRRVQSLFEGTPAGGKKVVSGNLADAWPVGAAPAEIREELEKRRRSHCCRTVEDWLNDPRAPWQPAIPLARADSKSIQNADKLQKALTRVLALPIETSIAKRACLAAEDFKKEFSYGVSDRHLRALITRTMDRDAGLNAWDRPEIYLPENTKPKSVAASPLSRSLVFPELEDAFATVEDRTHPTATDIAYCWRMIVECLSDRIAAGDSAKKLKKCICNFVLKSAPFLAESKEAFRRNVNRKLNAAADEGLTALADQRANHSGNKRNAPEWKQNIQLLAQWTRVRCGRLSQAWRELHTGNGAQGKRFSQAFRDYFPFDPRSAKSQVPSRVRAAIRPMIEATNELALGQKKARIALPSIHRDWSDTAAGDFHTCDDVTVNHYWIEWHEFGEYEFQGMRFNVVRGQWLPVCDERTDNPLSFLLMPNRNYNSWVIRTLNTKTFSDERIGLPFKGVKYEQNIWKARNIASQFSWSRIDEAFTRHNISLRAHHARGPKAKIIERVIGTSQNMMCHLPGYVGHDEKNVCYERVQKFLKSLKRVGQPIKGEVDPREMLLSKEQFADELVKVMRTFAEEPQNGERLQGLSPAEAWTQLSPGKPHTVLPDSLRYLLSTSKSQQTVTQEGIKLRIGSLFNYYVGNPRLGALRGEKVDVYYNEELPGHVIVIHPASDPRGLNPFSVPLFDRVPANTATADDFKAAKQHQKAFSSYGKETYRIIAPKTNTTIRDENIGSADSRQRGEKIHALEREHIEIETGRSRHASTIRKLASSANLAIDTSKVRKPERVIQSLTRAQELEEEIRRMEASDDVTPGHQPHE